MEKSKERPRLKGTAWAKNNSFLTVTVSVPERPKKWPGLKSFDTQSKLLLGLRAMGLSDTQIVNLLLWIGTGDEKYLPGSAPCGRNGE